ncbi:serine O-acetyltransferase [Haloarcula litorea]|uniref:serine O-acetyltransferase n=1 Tax=Haloarcula litorea TaxID=3032579 RepID=UPI0023E8600A|nr:serine O-acetyltransferase [Halomicroarcula sp. GDY20]
MFDRLRDDVRTALAKDPAATSATEVVLTYPGLHAVWLYRLAHALWVRDHRLGARLLSHLGRLLTGVEIHPGATVGDRLFVDHGMGTVVGETADVGDDVLMYHGVTLGGASMRREKRHPTLEDGVTVGADATIIGPVTVGENATVGAGAVVVDDVPPGTTVVGNPARPVSEADGDIEESAAADRGPSPGDD